MKRIQKTKEPIEKRYWRIRIKFASEDLNKKAWKENQVGIWYGKWTADDWIETSKKLQSL